MYCEWDNANWVDMKRHFLVNYFIRAGKATVFIIFSASQKWIRYDYKSCCPPKVMYAILHRKCEMGPFMQSYPKKAFATPIALFSLHVDQGKS